MGGKQGEETSSGLFDSGTISLGTHWTYLSSRLLCFFFYTSFGVDTVVPQQPVFATMRHAEPH